MSDEETAFNRVGEAIENAVSSQMFGKKCYKIGGKAFLCFFQDAMVFKLTGQHHTDALALNGSILFDPSGKGRPMKEWVQVSFEHQNQWAELANAAHDYVAGK
ncbi:hypothetical protein OAC63_00570 [Amylibacter sp.]|jgi:hypothetical protein|nr:hypothetical protein [Amylibacter sp.]MDB9856870.1 hypothetical protein [Amylibacter sp.]